MEGERPLAAYALGPVGRPFFGMLQAANRLDVPDGFVPGHEEALRRFAERVPRQERRGPQQAFIREAVHNEDIVLMPTVGDEAAEEQDKTHQTHEQYVPCE